jgi:hypothetical protein
MSLLLQSQYIAFNESIKVAFGDLTGVVRRVCETVPPENWQAVLIFDTVTSARKEVDFRGTTDEVLARLEQKQKNSPASTEEKTSQGPGRPRLGVVAREVTLLPRHWEWLNSQPGGASVALRKLVEEARRANEGKDRIRLAQEAGYTFLSVMAGDRPGFEEATRALFAGNHEVFNALTELWPTDIRDHARTLTLPVFEEPKP